MTPQNRIWELDAARGFCILGMVIIHFVYDLTELYPVLTLNHPAFFLFWKDRGGIAFFLISGICVTLGHHHLRRGAIVFGCGVLVSAATVLVGAMPIRFGVLQCLGLCMIGWDVFHRISTKALCAFGIAFAAVGLLFSQISVSAPYLYPLGLTAPGFESADFFPLLPYFGYFLLGAACGRALYPHRRSLFPHVKYSNPFLRFFCLCGRHSLLIYLIHQPVLLFAIAAALV